MQQYTCACGANSSKSTATCALETSSGVCAHSISMAVIYTFTAFIDIWEKYQRV